jgi:hypothetical protein
MGGECRNHEGCEKCAQNLGWEAHKKRSCLKDLGVDRRIILKYI